MGRLDHGARTCRFAHRFFLLQNLCRVGLLLIPPFQEESACVEFEDAGVERFVIMAMAQPVRMLVQDVRSAFQRGAESLRDFLDGRETEFFDEYLGAIAYFAQKFASISASSLSRRWPRMVCPISCNLVKRILPEFSWRLQAMYRLSLPFALIVNDMPLGQLQSVIKSSKETDGLNAI